jgi:hypothetical protein
MYSAEAYTFRYGTFVDPGFSSLGFFRWRFFFLFIPFARGFHLFFLYDGRLNLLAAGFQNPKYSLQFIHGLLQ